MIPLGAPLLYSHPLVKWIRRALIVAPFPVAAAACGGRYAAPYCENGWHVCESDSSPFCCRDGWSCGTGGNGCREGYCCPGDGP